MHPSPSREQQQQQPKQTNKQTNKQPSTKYPKNAVPNIRKTLYRISEKRCTEYPKTLHQKTIPSESKTVPRAGATRAC
jgi:hypothetical protein